MRDAEGEPLYYEGTVEDITQTLHANNLIALIALSERRFGALTEKAQMVTVLCDRFGKILFVSAAFERLLGYRTNVVEGANLFDFIHAADAYEQREELRRVGCAAARQFEVWRQPQLNLSTRALVGFASLLRWRHPTRGIVLPDEFIATAEDQGLIDEIGSVVREAAIAQAAPWSRQYARPLGIGINVSALELRGKTYAERLDGTLREHNTPAEQMDIEIIERVFVDTHTHAVEALQQLRSPGVKIALGDWGVAYSAISYLRKFPVNVVKLDRTFIGGLPESTVGGAIVRALLTLAARAALARGRRRHQAALPTEPRITKWIAGLALGPLGRKIEHWNFYPTYLGLT